MSEISNDMKFVNATVDKNGFVRSKKGNLKKVIANTRKNVVEHRDSVEADKLKKRTIITVYHGTTNDSLVPDYNYNNKNNDYGKGLYTTPDIELAKQWAYSGYTGGGVGYTYEYEIDLDGLNVLDFTKLDSMHWLAELVYNREIDVRAEREIYEDNRKRLLDKYKIDTSMYDIIIGYRADDSYFVYAKDFVSGLIYRDTLDRALRLGELDLQVFIRSQMAFNRLIEVDGPVKVDPRYRNKYISRDRAAREEYKRDRVNQTPRLKQRIDDFLD
ncbi:MAG: DUF3990 domain-containing protein [Lachnospiraceae bacterium]|nr:DUF3990 domain-containing protein [Lachnospiraceae bacterium]